MAIDKMFVFLLFALFFINQADISYGYDCNGLVLDGPEADGVYINGGCGQPIVDWRLGKDSIENLQAILRKGNVHVRLRGQGTLELPEKCLGPLGPNVTMDGTKGRVRITGPKFVHLGPKSRNILITGLCFSYNDNAVDMTDGGEKVWVTRNTFYNTSFGSPTAFRGYDKGRTRGTREIHISRNWYGPSRFGPGFFGGIDHASVYLNYMVHIGTRTPSVNTGRFHVCNNVIEGWDLGFQSHCHAHNLIEKNLMIVEEGWKSRPIFAGPLRGGDDTCGDDYERSTICWRDNKIVGNNSEIPLLSGANKHMVKFDCDWQLPFEPLPCKKIPQDTDKFRDLVKKMAGVPNHWCEFE